MSRSTIDDVYVMPTDVQVASVVDSSPMGIEAAVERWGHRASRETLFQLLTDGRAKLGKKGASMHRRGQPASHRMLIGWDALPSPAAALGLTARHFQGA